MRHSRSKAGFAKSLIRFKEDEAWFVVKWFKKNKGKNDWRQGKNLRYIKQWEFCGCRASKRNKKEYAIISD